MKKPKPEDYGITQDDISLEADNQRKRDSKSPGCIAQIICIGLWMLFNTGSLRFFSILGLFDLNIPDLVAGLLLLVWSIGSFFLTALLFNWSYDALWRKKIPAQNSGVLRCHEAMADYNDWLQNEERKKKEFWFSLSGHRFEKEFGKILKNNGYSIFVTKGSADGGVDIVAEKNNEKTIIQCKAHKNPIGPGPIRELFGVFSSGDFKAKSAIVVCLSGFTRGARDFASKNNIELWDVANVLKLAKQTDGTQQDDCT